MGTDALVLDDDPAATVAMPGRVWLMIRAGEMIPRPAGSQSLPAHGPASPDSRAGTPVSGRREEAGLAGDAGGVQRCARQLDLDAGRAG